MNRLKSRKLWIAIGTVVSILIAEFFGIQISPEALGAVALLGGSYIFGQGLVDKSVGAEQVRVAGDAGKLQLELYARNLERQLEEVLSLSSELTEYPTLQPVPDSEG